MAPPRFRAVLATVVPSSAGSPPPGVATAKLVSWLAPSMPAHRVGPCFGRRAFPACFLA